jgi:hypothetical protein
MGRGTMMMGWSFLEGEGALVCGIRVALTYLPTYLAG